MMSKISAALSGALTKISDVFGKYWFVLSTLAIAVMAYFLNKDEKTITELHDQVQLLTLKNKLQQIQEVATNDQQTMDKAQDSYDTLKRRHADLFAKLGIAVSVPQPITLGKPLSPSGQDQSSSSGSSSPDSNS